MSGDELAPLTRGVLATGVALTLGTGLGLWLVPGETAAYWAWEIRAPLSAAFLGAGYLGAAVSLALALRSRRGTWARASLVSALVLTALALLATVRHADTFLLGRGDPLPRAVAWIWLVVYVALPPLAALALVVQEGRRPPPPRERPLARGELLALGLAGLALAVPGALLIAGWGRLVEVWPWPLTPLTAELVGAWLLASAAALAWIAFRERDWDRARASVAAGAVSSLLLAVAAARLHGGLGGTAATTAYLAYLAGLLGLCAWLVRSHAGTRRRPAAYRDGP